MKLKSVTSSSNKGVNFHLSLLGKEPGKNETKVLLVLQNQPAEIHPNHLEKLVSDLFMNSTVLGKLQYTPNKNPLKNKKNSYSQITFYLLIPDEDIKNNHKFLRARMSQIFRKWREMGAKIGPKTETE